MHRRKWRTVAVGATQIKMMGKNNHSADAMLFVFTVFMHRKKVKTVRKWIKEQKIRQTQV